MNRTQWNSWIENRRVAATRGSVSCPARLRQGMVEATVIDREGVLRWRENRRVVMPAVFEDAGVLLPGHQAEAYRRELDEFMASYRPRYSEELLAEARRELGPNIVDAITGEAL